MNESKSIDILSFTDTGQWRLIIAISRREVSAILQNIVDESIPASLFFKKKFDSGNMNLLRDIESVIYDNPRILEDFATHIIITSSESLWIPSDFCDEGEFDENLFTCVYPARGEDIFSDFGENEVCVYTLTPGLNSFLQRTIPGCRISSHLSILKSCFETMQAEKAAVSSEDCPAKNIYVNVHDDYADIFAFDGEKMLCGATHQWIAPSDIAYKISLVADAYGLLPDDTAVTVYSRPEISEDIKDLLEEFFMSVATFDLPNLHYTLGIPLTSAVAAGERLAK